MFVYYIFLQIAIGLTTTIFLPESSHQNGNYIFVSGKFGQNHYITPQRIQLDENAVCCCVGISHSIICCSSVLYSFNDMYIEQLLEHISDW
jgi:hypothetical protein